MGLNQRDTSELSIVLGSQSKYLKRERARGENILKSTTGENDPFSVQNLRLIPDDDEEHGHAVELRLRDRGGAVIA